jgi:putative membrane protein
MMLCNWRPLLVMLADDEARTPFVSWESLARQIVVTVVFIVIGLIFFALSDWMVERVMPRTLRKGIEEDKNVALAIVVAAGILGVAWIVAAAIHGQ